jgi:hypothetical protein
VQGTRDDKVEVRSVEARALILLPSWRHYGVSSSNDSRRADGDAPLGPASFSFPRSVPHSSSSPCSGGQERGKTPKWLGLREGLTPGEM